MKINLDKNDSVMLSGAKAAKAIFDSLKEDKVPPEDQFACVTVALLLYYKASAKETGLTKKKLLQIVDETWDAF